MRRANGEVSLVSLLKMTFLLWSRPGQSNRLGGGISTPGAMQKSLGLTRPSYHARGGESFGEIVHPLITELMMVREV